MQGLNLIEQKPLFKACLSCVADVARNHETAISDKVIQVFNKLL